MERKVRVVVLAVLFSLAILCGESLSFAEEKFAYVDLSRTFSEYNKTKDYDKTLGEKEDSYTKERETKLDEIKKLQDKINLLSEKEKQEQTSILEEKAKGLQDFDRNRQTDLRKEQDEKMKEILKDIEAAISEYSKKAGYTMVFNDRVLVYQDKRLDITDEIIKIINKDYKQ